MKTVFPRLSQ